MAIDYGYNFRGLGASSYTGNQLTFTGSFPFSSSDFTVETFIKFKSTMINSGTQYDLDICGTWNGGPTTIYMGVSFPASGSNASLNLAVNTSNGIGVPCAGNFTFVTEVWYHIAWVRSGSSASIYINGNRIATGSITGTFTDPGVWRLNGSNDFSSPCAFGDYYLSSFRIVIGTALYTGTTYTVPTSTLTAISGTYLLTAVSSSIQDAGPNNYSVSNNVRGSSPTYSLPVSTFTELIISETITASDSISGGLLILVNSNESINSTDLSNAFVTPTLAQRFTNSGVLQTPGIFDETATGGAPASRLTAEGNFTINGEFDEYTLQTTYPNAYSYTDTAAYSVRINPSAGTIITYVQTSGGNGSVFNARSNNWTIEFWFKTSTYSTGGNGQYLLDMYNGSTFALDISFNNSGTAMSFYDGTNNQTGSLNSAYTLNQWNHFALVCNTTLSLYINGVVQSGWNGVTNNIVSNAQTTNITQFQIAAGSYIGVSSADMYYSQYRINNSTSVYTGNFTPPSRLSATQRAGTNINSIGGGTILLTCNSPSFVDQSTNAFTLTPYYNPGGGGGAVIPTVYSNTSPTFSVDKVYNPPASSAPTLNYARKQTASSYQIYDSFDELSLAYTITPDKKIMNEGDTVTYTINAPMLNRGTGLGTLYYTNAGSMAAADFSGGLVYGVTPLTWSGTSTAPLWSFTGVTQSATSGFGTGAVFSIRKNNATTTMGTHGVLTVIPTSPGSGYTVGDTITIAGASLGLTTPTNNLTITVGSDWFAQGVNPTTITGTGLGTMTAGSATWTCPDGVYRISVLCIGAGGAGNGATSGGATALGGGGGGALSYIQDYAVTPGLAYPVFAGPGGVYPSRGGAASYFLPEPSTQATASYPSTVAGTGMTNTGTGTFTWTCPAGVTSISIVCVGGGGGGGSRVNVVSTGAGGGGGGGGLAWKNNITVVPLTVYTIVVGAGGASDASGGSTYFIDASTIVATGGSPGQSRGSGDTTTRLGGAGGTYGGTGVSGGTGGTGGSGLNASFSAPGGGGGAGGYTGNGGNGGSTYSTAAGGIGGNGSGGAGAGGQGGATGGTQGTAGSGVGLMGQGQDGWTGYAGNGLYPQGGSGGANITAVDTAGGAFGGGGTGGYTTTGTTGGAGAIRIVWGGRTYPLDAACCALGGAGGLITGISGGAGGTTLIGTGFAGGAGGNASIASNPGGGGGAGGYTSAGAAGGSGSGTSPNVVIQSGSNSLGGGGGGGSAGGGAGTLNQSGTVNNSTTGGAGGGGGVGLLGIANLGLGGVTLAGTTGAILGQSGFGGSGGNQGAAATATAGGAGGAQGGGGGGGTSTGVSGAGGAGAIRIIWNYPHGFLPEQTALTNITNTKLLTAQSATITDVTGINTITNIATVTAGSTIIPFASTFSYQFNGTTQYLTIPSSSNFVYGATDDFTIEGYLYTSATTINKGLIYKRSGSNISGVNFGTSTTTASRFTLKVANATGSAWTINDETAGTFAISTWYHFAITKTNGVIYLYINGLLVRQYAHTTAIYDDGSSLNIGQDSGGAKWVGYLSNIRIIKGTALYYPPSTIVKRNYPDYPFIAENKGSIPISGGTGTLALTVGQDILQEGVQDIQLQLRPGSTSGTLLATAPTVVVADTSRPLALPGGGQCWCAYPDYVSGPNLVYTGTPGVFTFTAPKGYTAVSAVAIGAGGSGGGNGGGGGGGGALAYSASIAVTAGTTYTITCGAGGTAGGAGGASSFTTLVIANGGQPGGSPAAPVTGGAGGTVGAGTGFAGGAGGTGTSSIAGGGGGGAGGYTVAGGVGGTFTGTYPTTLVAGSGAASTSGGAGGSAGGSATAGGYFGPGGGGGGTSPFGSVAVASIAGTSLAGTQNNAGRGGGGSGGVATTTASGVQLGERGYTANVNVAGGQRPNGGRFGGGGGGGDGGNPGGLYGDGGVGCVRIIWGTGRAYPATLTADRVSGYPAAVGNPTGQQ